MNIQADVATRYRNILKAIGTGQLKKLYDRPVFIISAPRSGSTLLFESLSRNKRLWTLGEECHTIYRAIPELDPSSSGYASGALSRKQATPDVANLIRAGFTMYLRDVDVNRYLQISPENRPKKLRFLEKTPRNSLNIPFINKIFPDALYIFLKRDAASNINSMIEAWEVGLQNGSFVTFQDLPGWDRRHWCLLLPPGWSEMNGRPVADIAAFQWKSCNDIIMRDLKEIPEARKTYLTYEELLAQPGRELTRLLKFCGLEPADQLLDLATSELPLSKTTVSKPSAGKWLARRNIIEPLLPDLDDTSARLHALFKH